MTKVSCKTTINTSVETIWQVIRDFGGAEKYCSGVLTCKVQGAEIGALRTLTSADGSMIIERLDKLDETLHKLSYTLLTDTPFRNCVTDIVIHDIGPSQSELEWSATFQANGIPVSEAEEILEGALKANCLALKRFLEHWDGNSINPNGKG